MNASVSFALGALFGAVVLLAVYKYLQMKGKPGSVTAAEDHLAAIRGILAANAGTLEAIRQQMNEPVEPYKTNDEEWLSLWKQGIGSTVDSTEAMKAMTENLVAIRKHQEMPPVEPEWHKAAIDVAVKSTTKNTEAMQALAASLMVQPEWYKAAADKAVSTTLEGTEAVRSLTTALQNPTDTAPVAFDWDRIELVLEPIRQTLFRIAADTELGKKKFDVLAKVLGLDERQDFARHIDENPEDDNQSVFDSLVMEEMNRNGVTYKKAAHEVKSRMAHRNQVR